jgi:hypothetical protein
MSLDEHSSGGNLREVAAMLGAPDAAALAAMGMESFRKRTHRQLLEAARRLGIVGLSRMTKDALAEKVWESIAGDSKAVPAAAPGAEPTTTEVDSPLTHKFEVGRARRRHRGAADHPLELQPGSGHGDGRRSGPPVRLLGGE